MRKCDNMRDEADMQMEQDVIKECGLTQEEVDGFRQIFSANVNWAGELPIDALTTLLRRVVEMSDREAEDLIDLVRAIHPEGKEVARFPQFLRIVKKLTQDDTIGVNAAAARVVRRQSIRNKQEEFVRRAC